MKIHDVWPFSTSFFPASFAAWIFVRFTQKWKNNHYLLPPCQWNIKLSFVVHKTFLELYSIAALHHSSQQLKQMGTCFKMYRNSCIASPLLDLIYVSWLGECWYAGFCFEAPEMFCYAKLSNFPSAWGWEDNDKMFICFFFNAFLGWKHSFRVRVESSAIVLLVWQLI